MSTSRILITAGLLLGLLSTTAIAGPPSPGGYNPHRNARIKVQPRGGSQPGNPHLPDPPAPTPSEECAPCLFGCADNVCNGKPGKPTGTTGSWFVAAERLGAVDCDVEPDESAGTCDVLDGSWSWSWGCEAGECQDSSGMTWHSL